MSLADVDDVDAREHPVDEQMLNLGDALTGADHEKGDDPDNITKRPKRTTKYTEKGLEYQRTTWFGNREAIRKRLKRRGTEVENMIPTGSIKGVEEALARFEDTATVFQDTHNKYREVISQEKLADDEWFDLVDQDIFHVRHQAVSAIRCLRDEFDKRSLKSNQSPRSSKGSKSSKSSSRSKASTHSSVRDQMVKERLKLAELEAETKFVNEKVNLHVINHQKKLAKTRARMEVLEQIRNNEDEELEQKPKFQHDENHSTNNLESDEVEDDLKKILFQPHDKQRRGTNLPILNPTNEERRSGENNDTVDKKFYNRVRQPDTSELLVKLVKQQTAPDIDIETFDGDPMKIDYFIAVFKEVVESNIDDPKGRLLRLMMYTKGEARETIRHCVQLPPDTCYNTAIDLLRKRFGDRHLILATYRKELRNWQPLRYSDTSAFRTYLNFVVKCQSFIHDDWSVLDTPETICMLVSKLPPQLADRWNRKAMMYRQKKHSEPKLTEFVKFLEDETTLINDPLYSREALKQVVGYKEKPPDKRSSRNNTSVKTLLTGKDNVKLPSPTVTFGKLSCLICQGLHDVGKCPSLMMKPVEERSKLIGQLKLCFGCLKPMEPAHNARNCQHRSTCDVCNNLHPTCLHGFKFKPKLDDGKRNDLNANANEFHAAKSAKKITTTATAIATDGNDQAVDVAITSTNYTARGQVISMCVVPVRISHHATNTEVVTMAMLDSCSQATFASNSLIKRLGIDGRKTSLSIKTINGTERISSNVITGLSVSCSSEKLPPATLKLPKVYTKEYLPVDREEIATRRKIKRWSYLESTLDYIGDHDDVAVELLIGADCLKAIEPLEVIPSEQGGPYAYRTALGWCVVGPIDNKSNGIIQCNRVSVSNTSVQHFEVANQVKEDQIEEMVQRLYNRDFIENRPNGFVGMEESSLSVDEKRFLEIMDQGCAKQNGHYVLPLPFKGDIQMPNNRHIAEKRLDHLKRKFSKDQQFLNDYKEFVNKLITKGHAVKSSKPPPVKRTWYLPHHGVYHPHKPGKIRVVLDCGAEYQGKSLNKELLSGPDLTNQIVGVLSRFRLEEIGIMADVEAMFYQVLIPEDQRSFTRFLWWEDEDFTKEPIDYEMIVHIFGATSSASCSNYALRRTALDNVEKFNQDVRQTLFRNFYVDDMLRSKENVIEATQFIHDIRSLCQKGGFNLTKFVTNNPHVLASIPDEHVGSSLKDVKLINDEVDATDRALGVSWKLQEDLFTFNFKMKDKPLTRRGILSTVSSIYDPLGFVSPFVLKGRIILQRLCARKHGWDEKLPDDIEEAWCSWKNKLSQLEKVSARRCFKPANFGNIAEYSFHHFSDASDEGYGQSSYVRIVDVQGQITCTLIIGKARVCPLKFVSIPQMELAAAVLSVKIASLINTELEMSDAKHHFWTDSKVVLSYLKSNSRRFKTFVANRVQQIKSSTAIEDWRYVKSSNNPTDIASRGLNPEERDKIDFWFNGPQFLRQPEDSWEEVEMDTDINEDDKELKKVNVISTIQTNGFHQLIQNVSCWKKMKRIVVRVIRAVNKMQKKAPPNKTLQVTEIDHAAQILIKIVQRDQFLAEFSSLQSNKSVSSKSDIASLNPFIDPSGLIRVGGRLQYSNLDYEAKHPLLLPKKNALSDAIIRWCHHQIAHGGRGSTLNEVRQRGYWIVNGNSNVRRVVSKCVTCRHLRGRVGEQIMGSLPRDRTIEAPPFTYCGVDFFGPFVVRERRKELKRYGAIFSCFASRAVHIEVATSLDTDTFILVLRRFIARRGNVRTIYSDNGTNFVGAENELRKALQEFDDEKINFFLTQLGADWNWKFNPPAASHMGGIWESLDNESLTTLMAETEAIVNSRPLAVDTASDVNSPVCLSPINLLTMKSKVVLPPPGNFSSVGVYTRRRWRRVQHIANEFWTRWRKEYLQQLQNRTKWQTKRGNFNVGDIVLLKDSTLFENRNTWPIGKVVRTFNGNDGLVRCADVYVSRSKSVIRRPITKLVLLLEDET